MKKLIYLIILSTLFSCNNDGAGQEPPVEDRTCPLKNLTDKITNKIERNISTETYDIKGEIKSTIKKTIDIGLSGEYSNEDIKSLEEKISKFERNFTGDEAKRINAKIGSVCNAYETWQDLKSENYEIIFIREYEGYFKLVDDIINSKEPPPPPPTTYVSDVSGNKYKTIKLLGRIWLAENMRYDFNNTVKSRRQTDNNDNFNIGRYYTWDAAAEACLKLEGNWSLPTKREWEAIAQFTVRELNSKGFNLRKSGYYDTAEVYKDDPFRNIGRQGHWWSSSRTRNDNNEELVIDYFYDESLSIFSLKENPLPRYRYYMLCRCVKD